MLEKNFQKTVYDFVDALPNAWFYPTIERSRRGIPDLIGHVNGYFFALEIKRTKNIKSGSRKLQEYNIGKIERTGAMGFIVAPENWELTKEILLRFSEAPNVHKKTSRPANRRAS